MFIITDLRATTCGKKSAGSFLSKSNMDHTKFYTDNKFELLIDLRSLTDTTMHGSGIRLVNTKDGVFLEIERKTCGSGNLECHVFTISDP